MVPKRKIIVHIATSADGFIARSDGSVDWLDRPTPKGAYGMMAFLKTIDTILWGRKTYDTALAFQKEGIPGAGFDTQLKNFVFTRTLLGSPRRPASSLSASRSRPLQPGCGSRKGKTFG